MMHIKEKTGGKVKDATAVDKQMRVRGAHFIKSTKWQINTLLNIHGFSCPIKKTSRCVFKKKRKRVPYMLPPGTTPPSRIELILEWKDEEKVFKANGIRKQVDIAIVISDKINFKTNQNRQRKSLYTDYRNNCSRHYSSKQMHWTQVSPNS